MRACSPAGFTLIEVLVALLVLSVGLVGAASMHTRAYALSIEARRHSAATRLAASLAEKMRANRAAMSATSNPYLDVDYDSAAAPSGPPAKSCYGDTACTAQELALFDIDETTRLLHDGFARVRLVVCRDASPWDGSAGALRWSCDGASGAPVVIKIGWRGKDGEAGLAPGVALVARGGAS